MGSLVQTPHSEVTATLELLSRYGVTAGDLANLRSRRKEDVVVHLANILKHGEEAITDGMQRVHLIDGDADLVIPEEFRGWRAIEHHKCGKFRWDPDRVILARGRSQGPGPQVDAVTVRKELVGTPLNANALFYLYRRPWLIPTSWKHVLVYFWGTIFQGEDESATYRRGGPCVFCLQWFPHNGENNSNWRINKENITVRRFNERDLAAVRMQRK